MYNNQKISVVMATFNGINYIEEQLDSLRFQTLVPDEVIICDDASTDGTHEFLCLYVNRHQLDNWKVLKNSENHGWIRNFYDLFELTTGDIIFCADQDDIWLKNKIEIMTNVIISDSRIKVFGGNYVKVNGQGKKGKKLINIAESFNNGELKKINWNGKFYLTHRPGCAICFKKELLVQVSKMKKEYYPHDQLLWNIACILDGAYTINQNVILQRRHNESAMIKKKKQNNRVLEIENTLRIVNICEKYVSENIPEDKEKLRIIKEAEEFFKLRISFMRDRNIMSSFKLLKYISFYPKYRSFLADLKEYLKNKLVSE